LDQVTLRLRSPASGIVNIDLAHGFPHKIVAIPAVDGCGFPRPREAAAENARVSFVRDPDLPLR
jgi:hypothetical protein